VRRRVSGPGTTDSTAALPGSSQARRLLADLGVDRTVITEWVKKLQGGRYEATPGKPLKSERQSELEQLRRELTRVKMERNILTRALGYFAKDPT
jgi:transposase